MEAARSFVSGQMWCRKEFPPFGQITCPGVLLKDKGRLYLSICVFGQYKKTRCVPAAFPLFFEEKLEFEKVFTDVVDPGDLVELLELDTAVLELIQLVPPVGEILATYEENTRDFLFPDPKVTRGHHGSDREILMKRSFSFTGIAPKLRFSTSSLITESVLSSGRIHTQDHLDRVHHSTPNGKLQTRLPKKNTLSPEKGRHSPATKNYEQPTIASKSRSPSPYTKRRMCELSEEARQRLAHLNLGPFEFRRETDKPPFVVRRVEHPSPSGDLPTWCTPRESAREAWSRVTCDPSLLGSYRPKKTKVRSSHGKDLDGFSDSCDEHLTSGTARQFRFSSSLIRSAPSSLQKHSLSSVLNRSSLTERFNSDWSTPANGEEIHKRVKNILRTHSARQKLTFDESNSSKEGLDKMKGSSSRDSCKDSSLGSNLQSSSSVQQNTTVQLDDGEYWSSRAADYKGKPHRAIFEDSLEKIYRNMYKKASSTILERKLHS
ncbi:PREDICTED: spermatogenesis-associated protein 6 isoform X1 [Crocodylus porosus]|uniref:spermatogenesis-associated protein 6 isoform X1 n=1 Tax=Crocodylus porosus TaxID=8502 RepID=UPI00093AC8DF|nr:PREDICTED: spermatogenesis-associated protein 6 isoform X1 [Crocodylus porosus]